MLMATALTTVAELMAAASAEMGLATPTVQPAETESVASFAALAAMSVVSAVSAVVEAAGGLHASGASPRRADRPIRGHTRHPRFRRKSLPVRAMTNFA
jgi:hypothetical protein